jgi:hypothetical protein
MLAFTSPDKIRSSSSDPTNRSGQKLSALSYVAYITPSSDIFASERDIAPKTKKLDACRVVSKPKEEDLAPRARFELATLRLTAECSAVELPGNGQVDF